MSRSQQKYRRDRRRSCAPESARLRANAKFIKRAQQIQIVAEWLDAFHGDEKTDLFGIECSRNFIVRATNEAALWIDQLRCKAGRLDRPLPAARARKISILDVDRSADDPHPAGFELRQNSVARTFG